MREIGLTGLRSIGPDRCRLGSDPSGGDVHRAGSCSRRCCSRSNCGSSVADSSSSRKLHSMHGKVLSLAMHSKADKRQSFNEGDGKGMTAFVLTLSLCLESK